MKKRGFTLIELLAVIVILAIIALIAMPLVLNTIEKARQGAAKASAYAYAEEVERYIILSEIDPTLTKLQPGVEYKLSREKNEVAALADPATTYINDLVSIKGDKPTSGYLKLNNENKIEKIEMVMKAYPVTYDNGECEITGAKVDEDEKEEPEISYPSILAKAKTLVYDENGTCKTDGSTYNYMGGCYIKGANTSNYVWYNGFMWRIMGINSDNTVRLITDENVTVLAYGENNAANSYATTEGYIHDWLNEYFYNNLNNTKNIIQEGAYFCIKDFSPSSTACPSEKVVTTKIGLLTYDEYYLANSSSSYLDINQTFWTMTPFKDNDAYFVDNQGGVGRGAVSFYEYGARPVINISSTAAITAGDGSAQSFYVLGEDKITNVTGKISEKATSGEYVTLEGHTYRVVRKTADGVKLILDDFYRDSSNKVYSMNFGNDNTFTTISGIGQKLNTDVLEWLGLSTSDKIVETTYYQGDGIKYNNYATYNDYLKQSNGVNAKVGLMQIGDILTSHSSTMLTKNYTVGHNNNYANTYWAMNKSTENSSAWIVQYYSNATDSKVTHSFALRPFITVRNDLDITSGTGTWKNPYQI